MYLFERGIQMIKACGGLMLLVLLSCTSSTRMALTAAPPNLSIAKKTGPTPSPALIGENTTTVLRAELKDPRTGQEVFPVGTSIGWSCPWYTKNGGAKITNTSNISFSVQSDSRNATMFASFGAVGSYVIDVKAVASNSAWTPSSVSKELKVNLKVEDATVTITGDKKTGLGASDPTKLIIHGTATVQPASAANRITVTVKTGNDTDGQPLQSNVAISNIKPNTTTGKITFDWKGISASSGSPRNSSGSTLIEGQVGGIGKGSMRVAVITPYAIKQEKICLQGHISGQNLVLTNTSLPAIDDLPDGHVVLATVYERLLTITVLDQFQKSLDSLYVSAPVKEVASVDFSGNPKWSKVSVILSSSGTYQDPVAAFGYPVKSGDSTNTDVKAAMATWSSQPKLPIKDYDDPWREQNIRVSVANIELTQGIEHRWVASAAPDILSIRCPDLDACF